MKIEWESLINNCQYKLKKKMKQKKNIIFYARFFVSVLCLLENYFPTKPLSIKKDKYTQQTSYFV